MVSLVLKNVILLNKIFIQLLQEKFVLKEYLSFGYYYPNFGFFQKNEIKHDDRYPWNFEQR